MFKTLRQVINSGVQVGFETQENVYFVKGLIGFDYYTADVFEDSGYVAEDILFTFDYNMGVVDFIMKVVAGYCLSNGLSFIHAKGTEKK